MEINWAQLELCEGDSSQSKCYRDNKGFIFKDLTGGRPTHASDEYQFQSAAYKALPAQVPKPLHLGPDYIIMEDLGLSEKITDMVKVWDSAYSVLKGLKKAKVHHSDLRPDNLIIKNNIVHVIDFGWSRWIKDPITIVNEVPDEKRIFRSLALLTI